MDEEFERPVSLLFRRGLTEKKIAEVLRSGKADQAFLDGLAMLLDPYPGKRPLYKLALKMRARHRPKGKTFDENALVDALCELKGKNLSRGEEKRQRSLIRDRFGVSARTAENALRAAEEADELWEWLEKLEPMRARWNNEKK